jgi:rSAM/selenodomain-associated transferase 1
VTDSHAASVAKTLACRLLVFAKAPVPGQVKTRMQPHLSPQQSAQLHRQLVEYCLRNCASLPWSQLQLWVGSEHPWWAELQRRYALDLFQQRGQDLGQRMAGAVAAAQIDGCGLILIGTDCPDISGDYLRAAAAALRQYDVVLGPAEDGGYVLIGFSMRHRERYQAVFADVDWSTDRVLAQTRQRLVQQQLRWLELPVLADIDRPEDLRLLQRHFPGGY